MSEGTVIANWGYSPRSATVEFNTENSGDKLLISWGITDIYDKVDSDAVLKFTATKTHSDGQITTHEYTPLKGSFKDEFVNDCKIEYKVEIGSDDFAIWTVKTFNDGTLIHVQE